jgi:hypothetical protein
MFLLTQPMTAAFPEHRNYERRRGQDYPCSSQLIFWRVFVSFWFFSISNAAKGGCGPLSNQETLDLLYWLSL